MSIAALLHHHGVDVPRYVTVNGQIVFDDVQASPSGYVHSALGSVTPVQKHTFHGGEEALDNAVGDSAPWWTDNARLQRHISAMEQSFPGFTYLPASDGLDPCWGGELNTGRGKFKVLVMTRQDEGLPRVAVVGPKLGISSGRSWVPSPHIYLNGNLCVADQDDWDPQEHTVATVTAWAAHWLAAYTEWRITRRWPVEGAQALVA